VRRLFVSAIPIVLTCGCGPAADRVVGVPDTLVSVAGLSAPVRIVTDADGIPHIRAESLDDLYFAWGYVTARERLWQIAHNRAAAAGQRWRWMGNRVLQADGAAQLFEFSTLARRVWERESGDSVVGPTLRRYADGINAWIARCERGEAAWPVEFQRLRTRPAEWRPEDSALLLWSLAALLDLDLAELRERDEVERYGRDGAVSRRRLEHRNVYATIPEHVARRQWQEVPASDRSRSERAGSLAGGAVDAWPDVEALRRSLGRFDVEARASNVFAVGAGRSASGAPLLANDLHLGLTAPAPVMLIHVTVPGVVDAAGAFPPGLPAIVTGRNRTCAWGITSLAGDMLDVYADTLSADGKRVRDPRGEWVSVREADFDMRYRALGVPLPTFGQKRRYGPHGPILVWDRKARIAYSVRWTALTDTMTLSRLIGLERSRSAAELEERWSTLVAPGINVVAADRSGDVRYRAVGTLPHRPSDPGRGPVPGDGAHEWFGTIAREAMPAWRVPGHAYVVNGNNLPIGEAYPYLLPRYDWANDRARRMAELLESDRGVTLDEMAAVQCDVRSRRAARFLPALLVAADSLPDSLGASARAALDTLRAWDFVSTRDRTAPTVFWAWLGALQDRFDDVPPGLLHAALTGETPAALRAGPDRRPVGAASAAVHALGEAIAALAERWGSDAASWTYGRAHQARFAHPLAHDGENADLVPEPVPVDGDGGTPLVGRSGLPRSTDVTHAPVVRHVVDLASPDSSWAVIAPGNSGDAGGGHARDHLERWANHGYAVLRLDWNRIEGAETRLVPGR
jgi:penicillin amidase